MIYGGGGIVNANASQRAPSSSATSDRSPSPCTVMGLGAFPAPHEQWLGMLGMHGTRTANYAMDEADLIVAIGARFDDRITGKLSEFAPRAKFVHIDVDPAEISKNVPRTSRSSATPTDVLPKLPREYRALKADPARLDEWWEQIQAWQAEYPLRYEDSSDSEIKPQLMIEAMYEATERRRDHHLRRRPAPDVGGAVLPLLASRAGGSTPAASARWASGCRRRSGPRSRSRTRPSSASPATAAWSWSARRWPPPPSTTSRSRSS